MIVGVGFYVTLPDAESETDLLNLFRKRAKNYPMIAKVNVLPDCPVTYPVEYIVASLDGVFLKMQANEHVPCFNLRLVSTEDLEKINMTPQAAR